MVEVFKTTVNQCETAHMLVDEIQKAFKGYHVNFDLEDCDRILRVEYHGGRIQPSALIHFLKTCGVDAEVLTDDLKETDYEQNIYNRANL